MAKHRQNNDDDDHIDDQQTVILPQTVEELAASERAEEPRRLRLPRRLVIPAVVVGVLVASCGGVWALSGQSDRFRLLLPSTVDSPGRGNAPIEGFGEASASPSSGPSGRPSPRVSPSGSNPAAPPNEPSAGPPPPPLPLAHYRFDEGSGGTAANTGEGGGSATVAGGAAFVTGRLGNAVEFTSASQYVSLPAGILSAAPEFTFAAWVRLDSASNWSRVFDFGSSTSVNMFLTARSDTGTARFAITTGGNGKEQRINGPSALPTGSWTHVAVTLSGGVGILYVNRAEVARTTGMTFTPVSLGNTSHNWIGRSQYSSDPYFDGVVDDVRLYARALPASEIANLP